jgi:hypothetical protein
MDVMLKPLVAQTPRSERPLTMLYTILWALSSTPKVDFGLSDPESLVPRTASMMAGFGQIWLSR